MVSDYSEAKVLKNMVEIESIFCLRKELDRFELSKSCSLVTENAQPWAFSYIPKLLMLKFVM